jgi:hypothetical protein
VIAIPLLAPRDPMSMSGLSSWEAVGYRFGPIVAEALAIIGLAWMVRIWRGPTGERPPACRYRE